MPERHFSNFDITIRHATFGERLPVGESDLEGPLSYPVTAIYRSRTAEGTISQDIHAPFWQEVVMQLADPTHTPGSQRMMDIGARLFDDLIKGAIRDLWVTARGDLDADAVAGIRLRLALQPPAVACLPWESLHDCDRNETFAASGQTPLVRVENLFRHVGASRTLRTQFPITILVAAPTDPTGQLDASHEIAEIKRMAAQVDAAQMRVVTFTGRFDIVDLRREIEAQQPDILHLIGHGQPEGILLWKQNEPTWAPASSLRVILQRSTSVKLVVLNVCLAGRVSDRTPFSTVGPQLLQAGVPAVVAMQFDVLEQTAADFASSLYEELVAGPMPGAIDAAVGYARSNLYALEPNSFGYGTPVLWLNAEDGIIFELEQGAGEPLADPPAEEAPSPSAVDAVASHPVDAHTLEPHMRSPEASPSEAVNVTQAQIPHTSTPPEPQLELRQLQAQDNEIVQWLATQREIVALEPEANLRNLIAIRNDELQNIQDQFRQLRGFKAEHLHTPNPAQPILKQYQSRIARILQKKQRVDSMSHMIRQQLASE